MNLVAHLKAKRESISSHVAWGAVIGLVVSRVQGPDYAWGWALVAGFLWEVLTAIVTRRWKPNLLDVPPWLLGGLLGALLSRL